MTTCAEWTSELAELRAAEKEYLLGNKTNRVHLGEHDVGYNNFDYSALQQRIRVVQAKVDRCNGCRGSHGMISVIPVDSNSDSRCR
jgi:hypothetical protein